MNGVNGLRDMQRFARLIETGQFNAKAMATTTYRLDQAQAALQAVSGPDHDRRSDCVLLRFYLHPCVRRVRR